MAIQAKAGTVSLHMRNTNRELATVPIKFPSIKLDPAEDFSWCVWVRATAPKIPLILTVHSMLDGSQMNIGHDGNLWMYTSRNASVGLPTIYWWGVTFDAWEVICLTKRGSVVNMYHGIENINEPAWWTVPVQLTRVITDLDCPINSDLDYFMLLCNSSNAIAGFKIWNHALTQAEMQSQCLQWHGNPTIGPRPFWVSPLRVPGDVSNVQDPYTGWGPTWNHGHAYTEINPSVENLTTIFDPAYMANSSLCNAWIYPAKFPNIFVDPGTMPAVPTTYKSPASQNVQFQDLGSIATEDFQIASIDYYAAAFGGIDPGTPFIECWGLYFDENGTEITDMSNPAYMISPGDTKVTIPPGPIKGSTMYFWKFGGQFKYAAGMGEANTAHLAYLYLYVTYQGYPTGVPHLPSDSLTGLFIIRKPKTIDEVVDRYNRGTELKIPDPTVRTAFIGE